MWRSTYHVDYSVRVCRACTVIVCVCKRCVYRGVYKGVLYCLESIKKTIGNKKVRV